MSGSTATRETQSWPCWNWCSSLSAAVAVRHESQRRCSIVTLQRPPRSSPRSSLRAPMITLSPWLALNRRSSRYTECVYIVYFNTSVQHCTSVIAFLNVSICVLHVIVCLSFAHFAFATFAKTRSLYTFCGAVCCKECTFIKHRDRYTHFICVAPVFYI